MIIPQHTPHRLESILLGTPLCNESCADQMANTLTVHIRARFTNFSAEWLELNPQVPTAGLLKAFIDSAEASGLPEAELGARLSKFFMERLTLLFALWQQPGLVDKLAPVQGNESDPVATRQQRLTALLHQPHVLQLPALVRGVIEELSADGVALWWWIFGVACWSARCMCVCDVLTRTGGAGDGLVRGD